METSNTPEGVEALIRWHRAMAAEPKRNEAKRLKHTQTADMLETLSGGAQPVAWPKVEPCDSGDKGWDSAYNAGAQHMLDACQRAGFDALIAKTAATDIERLLDRLIKAAWDWGYDCCVDSVSWGERGDSHNEWQKRDAYSVKRDLLAAAGALAALSAQPVQQAAGVQPIPPEIISIIDRLHTQDNRITENPLFAVQQKNRIYGLDDGYEEGKLWVNDDGSEFVEKPDDDARQLGYRDEWEFVTGCLTEQGCKDFITINGHNLKEPRIYAYGSYRNEEWKALRKWLMGLAASPDGQESPPIGERG